MTPSTIESLFYFTHCMDHPKSPQFSTRSESSASCSATTSASGRGPFCVCVHTGRSRGSINPTPLFLHERTLQKTSGPKFGGAAAPWSNGAGGPCFLSAICQALFSNLSGPFQLICRRPFSWFSSTFQSEARSELQSERQSERSYSFGLTNTVCKTASARFCILDAAGGCHDITDRLATSSV